LFEDISEGHLMRVNDELLTHRDARARLDLSNGTIIRVGPLSHFILKNMGQRAEGPFTRLKLEIGELFIILKGGSLDVDTPAGLASVRGSYMSVRVIRDTRETMMTCLEGNCQLGSGGGAVNLVAGQSAVVQNFEAAPAPGNMSHDDVAHWLEFHPEATMVVVPLTPSVETLGQEVFTPTSTPTPDSCPHPEGWTAITIAPGDTFESLAATYVVSAEELASANCMDTSAKLAGGMIIFVPSDAGAATPTALHSATPSATATPTASGTAQPSPTSSTGSGTNAEFLYPSGPINEDATCENLFSIDVIDPDGVDYVEVEYSVNDAGFSNSTFARLTYQGGDTYKGFVFINTFANPGTDTVYWRFATADIFNNHQWFPSKGSTPFSYSDSRDCGGEAAPNTTFANLVSPADGSDIVSCANFFSVDVSDPDGLAFVKIEYKINDPNLPSGTYFTLTQSGNTWSGTLTIPTSAPGDTVYWRIWVIDGLGNYIYKPNDIPYSYIDPLGC
jgi:hypothetical protein